MPAGVTRPPRRVPLHDVVGVWLPEEKVGGVPFGSLMLLRDSAPLACLEIVQGVAAQPSVFREALEAKVDDAIVGDIGVIFGDQFLDDRLHLGDVIRRVDDSIAVFPGDFDPQLFRVFDEGLRVVARYFIGVVGILDRTLLQRARFLRLFDPTRGDGHLVFAAAIGDVVVGHVTDVCDVHRVDDVVSGGCQESIDDVRKQEGTEVSDVAEVVDGRTARIHPYDGRFEWLERFVSVRQCVVKRNFQNNSARASSLLGPDRELDRIRPGDTGGISRRVERSGRVHSRARKT